MPIINRYLKGSTGEPQPVLKYGLNIENLFGDVDADGNLLPPEEPVDAVFSGIKSLSTEYIFQYRFYDNKSLVNVTFPDLESINGNYCVDDAFYDNTNLETLSFPKLKSINGSWTAHYLARGATSLTSLNMPELESITGSQVCDGLCCGCTSLQYLEFPKLKEIIASTAFQSVTQDSGIKTFRAPALEVIYGNAALQNLSSGSTVVETIDLRKLHAVGNGATQTIAPKNSPLVNINLSALTVLKGMSTTYNEFKGGFTGYSGTKFYFPMLQRAINPNYCFYNNTFNTDMREIHFRTDATELVPTLRSYSTKWGATNATIYYDLVSRIMGNNGVWYDRCEDDSLYDENGNKTYVCWENNQMIVNDTEVFMRTPAKDGFTSDNRASYGWTSSDGTTSVWTRKRHLDSSGSDIVYSNEECTSQYTTRININSPTTRYTLADSEPKAGDAYYNESGEQVGTIYQIS